MTALFTKKPITIEAHQWFRNGDHPQDGAARNSIDVEGALVRRFRRPDLRGEVICEHCSNPMFMHGWIDTLEDGHRVCPGDWIIKGVQGEFYPCKPDIFIATYSPGENVEQDAVPTIADLQERAYSDAKSKGWHDRPIDDGTRIALMHSELSEALEELRNGHRPTYYKTDGEGREKPEGWLFELADCVIRIFDFCGLQGQDLESAIIEKMDFNAGRSYRHGGKQF